MPRFVIERQYLLPVYEQLLIEAPNLGAACREALDDYAHPWSENTQEDFDSARPTTITGAVELRDDMCPELQDLTDATQSDLGELLYHSGLDALPIPAEFAEESEIAAGPASVIGFG